MYRYNPDSKSEISKLLDFDEFKFEPPSGTTFEQIAKYIIYLYDKDSELRSLIFDYRERKKESAKRAGFRRNNDGHFNEESEKIIFGKNEVVNHAIMFYLRQSNDPDFILYSAFWELLSKEIEESFSTGTPKERETVRKNIEELGNKISELEKHIFGGVESEELRRTLYADMEKQKLRLKPEISAKDIKAKKLTVGDPYYGKK